MKLRKILSWALSLVMVLGVTVSLASCGSQADLDAKAEDETAEKGKLIVGLDDTFAPMGFRDENNELVGFDIDLANAVGEELGMEVEFKSISWDAKDLELTSKNIDCIWNGMSVTDERKENMALSYEYLDNKIILMKEASDTSVTVKDAKDLENYKIGTQADSAALEMLQANEDYDKFKDNIVEYSDYDKALLDLKAGRIQVLAIDQVLGEYKNNNLDGELAVCDYSLGNDAYAIGFRKEDTALRDAVDKALKTLIDNGTAEELSEKWFGTNIVIYKAVY